MEITEKIKAKIFAEYLNQNAASFEGERMIDSGELLGLNLICKEYWIQYEPIVLRVKVETQVRLSECKLVLKPLSSISDEDAYNVSLLMGMVSGGWVKEVLTNFPFNEKNNSKYYPAYNEIIHKGVMAFQYLKSKGYDLPHHILGGSTLFDCGLCIYEQKNN